jgi:hypothetical protein
VWRELHARTPHFPPLTPRPLAPSLSPLSLSTQETFSAGAPPPGAAPPDLLLYDGSAGAFQVPCSLNGLAAAASGGALGWVFGFGEGDGERQRGWVGGWVERERDSASTTLFHTNPNTKKKNTHAGSQMIKHTGPGRLRAGVGAGWTSATSFASFGGVYAAAACVAGRLRDREDGA